MKTFFHPIVLLGNLNYQPLPVLESENNVFLLLSYYLREQEERNYLREKDISCVHRPAPALPRLHQGDPRLIYREHGNLPFFLISRERERLEIRLLPKCNHSPGPGRSAISAVWPSSSQPQQKRDCSTVTPPCVLRGWQLAPLLRPPPAQLDTTYPELGSNGSGLNYR